MINTNLIEKRQKQQNSVIATPPLANQRAALSVIHLFDQQARKTPQKIAVYHSNHAYDYGTLQQVSHQMALALIDHGVSPGDRVAICIKRSIDLIPIFLAVLRCGAAYIPLDTTHPASRNQKILESATPTLMIYDEHSLVLKKESTVRSLHIREQLHNKKSFSKKITSAYPPVDLSQPSLPAYIIFTSGSTGQPKGVQVSQQSLCRFLQAVAHEPGCNETDKVAALTTVSFDIAALEIYLPLITGAEIHLFDEQTIKNGELLANQLQDSGITLLQATPAHFRLMMASGWRHSQPIKKILCGGDQLNPQLATQLLTYTDELWNMYGPTEATVWSTCKRIIQDKTVSIGYPIAGTSCCIIDNDQIVPHETEGELWIAGLGLADGYYNDKDKTDDKFVWKNVGHGLQRYYRTGDKAIMSKTGELKYIGRIDFQVKIRGYRIELQEIEAVASAFPNVAECIATVQEDHYGEQIIVLCILPENQQTSHFHPLREYLKTHLPTYMIPSRIVTLNNIPLNTNGKVDRKAILNFISEEKIDHTEHQSNSNKVIEEIRHIWCDTLNIKHISNKDDFFDLGGHSILAFMLTKRVEDIVRKKVSLGLIFRYSTFSNYVSSLKLDQHIHQEYEAHSLCTSIPLNKAARESNGHTALIFICGINIYQDITNRLSPNIEAHAIYIEAEEKLFSRKEHSYKDRQTIEKLADRYVLEIQKLNISNLSLCGLSFGGILATVIAKKLEKKSMVVRNVFMLDSVLPNAWRMDWKKIIYKIKNATTQIARKERKILTSIDNSICQPLKKARERQFSFLKETMFYFDKKEIDLFAKIFLIKAQHRIETSKFKSLKEDYGWKKIIVGKLEITETEGEHISMVSAQHAHNVANIINLQLLPIAEVRNITSDTECANDTTVTYK
ncbi:non-ribosomal peptide synthetase [Marinibactrum halimedae]|uniref:Carrier domain-containing protein n=1 Tax=Marinibactrum halimedae TaxID=1444977 RepID=A0AA37T926_9GAMM|nr:amino acid adenylation domain-containing protein [Marinibactrum halimedae]MCD9460248.1 non-ribosomal peptide synthetase [Marinibactrum halimedae]GLS27916.1 hypothetical protein GCM10007877_36350 [Marinibactrum halimedae]